MRLVKVVSTGIAIVIAALFLSACAAPEPTATPTGCFETQNGRLVAVECRGGPTTPVAQTPTVADTSPEGVAKAVFLQRAAPPCAICHKIEGLAGATGQIGPDLTHIGSAHDEAYIRQAIEEPNAVIAPNCPTGGACPRDAMPQNYKSTLTAEQLDALVTYLSSLK